MATNFTNKYMQVFQDYNEFSEHSADYVRGEDHIAFLIEENEVIYWLYLEQVWRPLNVRTTTTGQLEDGRTKVAVRLEYIEGGQKYTSVPNIPDPERITSMSRFLEDYPDIEEVNISGTVNLTDLSYAFAGSKIKDFSMLDTSNVINITAILENVVNENLECIINTNVTKLEITRFIKNATIKGITINALNATSVTDNEDICIGANFEYINVNAPNAENQTNYIEVNVETTGNVTIPTFEQNFNIDLGQNKIYTAGKMYFNNNNNNGYRKEDGGTTTLKASQYIIFNYRVYPSNNSTFIIDCNDIRSERENYFECQFGSKIIFNENTVFGEQLWFNNFSIACNGILNDAIYQKYAGHKISIFQYNIIGESVADVNISNEVDSNLIYTPYNINDSRITFDVSNINIEIYNKLNISFSANEQLKYNKFIIDNSSLDLSEDNLPKLSNSINIYNSSIDYDRVIANEECKISGKYNCNNKGIADLGAFKDITFYNCPTFSLRYELTNRNINFNDCNNINISNYNDESNFNPIKLLDKENNNIIKSILTASSTWFGNDNIPYFIVDYLENKQVVISNLGDVSYLCWFLNYYDYTSEDKPIIIKSNTVLCYKTFNQNNNAKKENIYIDCQDAWLEIGFNPIDYNSHVNNIYGNVILRISHSSSNSNPVINNANIQHIDITKVILDDTTNRYEMFNETLDNESTIKLITMLEDNTRGQTKTIYMYRSQANIIGEDNIAGAIAKNYEIAIIEN